MEQVNISVIVPVYNIKEEYLRKCIDTLLNQTMREIEIIVVDDGSCKQTADICDEISSLDSRIIVIHQENKGVSVARNVGIDVSKGKWIAFVDPDDFVELDMFEKLYNSVGDKENEIDMIFSDAYVNYENDISKPDIISFYNPSKTGIEDVDDVESLQLQIIYKRISKYYPKVLDVGVPWAKLYSARLVKENQLKFVPNMVRMQDGIFNLYALEHVKKLKYLHLPLYHYRKIDGSVTNKYNERVISFCENHFYQIDKFISKYNKSQKYKEALNLRIVSRLQYYVSSYFFNSKNKKSYKLKKKEIEELISKQVYKEAILNVNKKYLHIYMYLVAKLLSKKMYFLVYILNKIKVIVERKFK